MKRNKTKAIFRATLFSPLFLSFPLFYFMFISTGSHKKALSNLVRLKNIVIYGTDDLT